MQLGWVDFSNSERNKVMDVIRQLDTPGAVDELGIGVIRDAFANCFFPGTSTIQTRAKYFLIVPYLLKEIGDMSGDNNVQQLIQKLTESEMECANLLLNNCRKNNISTNGIIGIDSLPYKWVVRGPADIYWNGIRTYEIFSRHDMSIRAYLQACITKNTMKSKSGKNKTDEDEEADDIDAGALVGMFHWDLKEVYDKKWRNNLSINLSLEEARYLKHKIEITQPNSLMALMLENNIDLSKYDSFEDVSNAMLNMGLLSDRLVMLVNLANSFNRLYQLATTRYNVMYSLGKNAHAVEKWKECSKNLALYSSVDLDEIDRVFLVKNRTLMIFLRKLQKAFVNGNIDLADELIRKQEKDIKSRNRAKLFSDVNTRDVNKWIGGELLDYRFHSAKEIINDIQEAEVRMNA